MTVMWKKILSMMLVVALIVTIAPWPVPEQASAAEGNFFTFKTFSNSPADPTEVTTKVVNLEGTFEGVAVDSITYKVEQIVGGTVYAISNGSAKPIIAGRNFQFTGVSLFEGLNHITVSGRDSSGSIVTGVAYVVYNDTPIVTSVNLSDGRVIPDGGEPLIAGPLQPVISVTAPNASRVTINGQPTFSGGGSVFLAQELGLLKGVNDLKIIAESAGKTYEVNRKLVYFDGTPTVYDLRVGGTVVDNATLPALTGGTVTGKIALPLPAGTSEPDIAIALVNSQGTVLGTSIDATTVTEFSRQGQIIIYQFSTTAALAGETSNGEYGIRVSDNWRGVNSNTRVKFNILNPSQAHITGIVQLVGVTESGGTIADNGATELAYPASQTLNIPSLPIYIEVQTRNTRITNVQVETLLEGSTVPTAVTATTLERNGNRVFKITSLPQGKQTLRFKIASGSTLYDTATRNAEYLPIPAIRLTNIADNMRFDDPDALTRIGGVGIKGRLANFPAVDYGTLKMTFNGVVTDVSTTNNAAFRIDPATGIFTVDRGTPAGTGIRMVEGANVLTFSARANGIPITTTVTVYFFSKDVPMIQWINPVRDIIPAHPITTKMPDPFFISTEDRVYSTTEEKVDVLFEITNAERLIVRKNGEQIAMAEHNTPTPWAQNNANLSTVGTDGKNWRLKSELPQTGPTTFTITVIKGSASISQTITIIRELPTYQILSPHPSKERIVNQNFLNISIQAPGALRITVGKQEMTKGLNDIFRMTYTGLKKGSNRIKFTVIQSEDGKTKFDDEINVTYAGDTSVGAQFKMEMASKMNVFGGEVALNFPKNTFLQQVRVPGQTVNNTELYENQALLFGIADKNDGRTVKSYNIDGTISQIAEDVVMKSRIAPLSHYMTVSNLIWIDAGYMKQVGENVAIPADHPYRNDGDNSDYPHFMFRVNDTTKWLEPSQRGTITMKFDSDIRNVSAGNVSVWRLNGQTWENIGGIVDVNKKTVTAPFDKFGYYAVMMLNYSYNDILSHGYGRDSMELLLARGIMEAKDANEFGTYDNITRGEFAQMLVKMAGIELDYDPDPYKLTFIDVPASKIPGTLWDYRYIETAARKGIVRGITPRLFSPNDPLTREQAAVMIARALNLLKGKEDIDKDRAAVQKQFTDANLVVDVNSFSAIQAVVKAGYINGIPNTTGGGGKPTFRFDPRSNLTRGDAAVITVRVMKKAKMI